MAGASDKARFYLEQYVPELREYERKGIFTSEEITAIASKRSDFEHTLNARGSRPSDYARYATYEMNLDRLRKTRSKRLGVKNATFTGQRTIFFILDRATKKFPGDMGLWMQYVHFCQKEKANKKLAKLFTNLLRLKPRDWGLWVLAAKHYAENQGDMSTARSYMHRGLRFCKDEVRLWLEYLRLEMVYLAKLTARRKVLGLDQNRKDTEVAPDADDADFLTLPTITTGDMENDLGEAGQGATSTSDVTLDHTPVFTGGIPIAIFDSGMKQFGSQAEIAEQFFEVVASFDQVSASLQILRHMLDHMKANTPDAPETILCEARLPLIGIDPQSSKFPTSLGKALTIVKQGLNDGDAPFQIKLSQKAVLLLLPLLRLRSELDPNIVKVLESSFRRYLRALLSESLADSHSSPIENVNEKLTQDGKTDELGLLREYYESIKK